MIVIANLISEYLAPGPRFLSQFGLAFIPVAYGSGFVCGFCVRYLFKLVALTSRYRLEPKYSFDRGEPDRLAAFAFVVLIGFLAWRFFESAAIYGHSLAEGWWVGVWCAAYSLAVGHGHAIGRPKNPPEPDPCTLHRRIGEPDE